MLKPNMSVIIFGCGDSGKSLYALLTKNNIKVSAFLDNSPNLAGTTYNGISIVPPEQYANTQQLVIIAALRKNAAVIPQLQSLNIKRIVQAFQIIDDIECTEDERLLFDLHGKYISSGIESAKDSVILYSIDFVVTEKCSLKCKDCANLMQYFESPQNADFIELTTAFDRLYKSVDYIYELRILGGEPLMCPDLPRYLEFLKSYPNIGAILIYSNGTIRPSKRLIEALDSKHVFFRISNYGLDTQNIKQVVNDLRENGIKVSVADVIQWQDCSSNLASRNMNASQLLHKTNECCVSNTLSIKNGKLWRCPFAGSVYSLGAVPDEKSEYVDLIDESISPHDMRSSIQRLLELPWLKVCDYCAGRPSTGFKSVTPAIQTHKPLKYTRMKPFISFIIPVYNRENEIDYCLSSILCFGNKIEVILIDDCSMDGSAEKCLSYEKKFGNVKFIALSHNRGPGYARNVGMREAQGQYLFFLDSDDSIFRTDFEKLMNTVRQSKVQIVSFNAKMVNMEKEVVFEKSPVKEHAVIDFRGFSEVFPNEPFYDIWMFMFNRDFVEHNAIQFAESYCFENVPFFLKAISKANLFLLEPLTPITYTMGSTNSLVSQQNIRSWIHEAKKNVVGLINDLINDLLNDNSISERHNYIKKIANAIAIYCNGEEYIARKISILKNKFGIEKKVWICPARTNFLPDIQDLDIAGFCDNNIDNSNPRVFEVQKYGYEVLQPDKLDPCTDTILLCAAAHIKDELKEQIQYLSIPYIDLFE